MHKTTPAPGQRRNLGPANSLKTAETMRRVIQETRTSPEVLRACHRIRQIARRYNLPVDLAAGLYAFKAAYYEPDIGNQTIRTPARTIRDKRANCVDYTVLICAIGTHFFDRVQFELAAYGPGDFTHVYPVLNGKPVDVVPDQNQTGLERVTRPIGKLPTLAALRATIEPERTQIFDV